MQVSHKFTAESAVFDEENLVSLAGLVPVMRLAEQTGLVEVLAEKVSIDAPRIKSGSANPSPKLATLIAGMCAGADSIDDVDVLRSGGMTALFDRVYAPSTIGTLLREFSFGHARQLESVLRAHLGRLCERVDLLPGADARAFVDIDSLLRPVYGHAKQGASYGFTKIAGKQVLRKGLSPLATTISTDLAAPVIAGMRLRAGKTGSAKGAGRMVSQAIATARAAGVTGEILVRGDSAYGTRSVISACRRAGVRFSLVLTKNPAVARAIASISDDGWTAVKYPGAVRDPDTGEWISDAEVAEIPYTAFASKPDRVTARLIVRRVKDAARQDSLFPVWRYHPFLTDSTESAPDADITHRRHAVIETVFADLIDGPLAHIPSGRFGANSAWVLCAAIAHNLLRATGALASPTLAESRGSTLRRKIIVVPARFARPQRKPVLHLPAHWPWTAAWQRLWHTTLTAT
ncbi:IS1380 family transposase [Nocardia sp. 2YAB30]|uniref:IS1380 family transposase n=1 Tax=Nocardia sp. 2YAB30 TaxID=3233022 RepID=UPI003F9CBE7A